MDHPLLATYRSDGYSATTIGRALDAQALYDSLPGVCPDCGFDDSESLIADEARDGSPAWVCGDEDRCDDRRAKRDAKVAP